MIDILNNLPKDYLLEKEKLFTICSDCGEKTEIVIRARNIFEGEHYCKICYKKHRKPRILSDEARKNIGKGALKRSGKGICKKCEKESEKRNAAGLCSECYSYLKNAPEINSKSNNCSICGKYNKLRD